VFSSFGIDSCTLGVGSANGAWEPGEHVRLSVSLVSDGLLQDVRGVLYAATAGVSVLRPTARWGNLGAGVPTQCFPPEFLLELDPALPCGTTIDLLLRVSAAVGGPYDLSFEGRVGDPLTFTCEGCCVGAEATTPWLTVSKRPGGHVALRLPEPVAPCARDVGVFLAASPRPAVGRGRFPTDPPFLDVTGDDLDADVPFEHEPPPGLACYLAVERLSGDRLGSAGHYGP
jgi:hypothetical protein